jgi:hypothetical protein
LLFLVFVLGQATMGISMLLFGRKSRLFRSHPTDLTPGSYWAWRPRCSCWG